MTDSKFTRKKDSIIIYAYNEWIFQQLTGKISAFIVKQIDVK